MSKIFLLFSIGVIITLQANYQYLPRDIKQVIFHEVIKSCLTTENYKQILCLKLIDKESSLIFSDFMRNFSDRSIKAKNDLSLIALSSNEQIQILMNNESQATCLLSWLGDFISNKLSQYKDEQKIVIDFQLVCCHRLLKQISTLPGAEQLLMSAHNAVYSVYQAVLFTAICVQDYGYIDQLLNKNIAINHKIFRLLPSKVLNIAYNF